jgi:two-component system sensor histidine kinase TctE
MTRPRERWLQRELHWRLMLPVLTIVVFSTLLSAYSAEYLVDRVFDRWLLDAARSLAAQVRFVGGRAVVELTEQSEAMLTYDVADRVSYEVVQDGRHVVGQSGLPMRGPHEHGYGEGARAYDGLFAGQEVRVAWVPVADAGGAQAEVAVAETLIKRARARRDLLLAFAPVGLLVVAAALVIAAAVRSTLSPLERIAARWNERSHASLEPIPAHDVPRELTPFATALNDLLARVRDLLDRERRFAANAAHQLRTPLAGLQLGLARRGQIRRFACAREVLRELGPATQRTARLVQQLLALSRLDPELRTGLELADVDLVALAHDVGESYLDAAQQKRIVLELEDPGTRVFVRAHSDLLSEALGNLIDNAIRYTPAGGRVVISVQDRPAVLAVSDSGAGIAADERDAVFERFTRGRGAVGVGSGLGLAIVREIAALHGADLALDHGPLGGTRITMRFA